MGLAVEVGYLVDLLEEDPEGADEFREELANVNRLLLANGLPEHHEPGQADWDVVGYDLHGYSGLHYLRRVAAHLATSGALPPPGDEHASDDPVLRRFYEREPRGLRRVFARRTPERETRRFSHLIDHSDAEGFYVPIEFDRVLYATSDAPVAGEMLGSSHTLAAELEEIARALDLPPELDPDSEELWKASDDQGNGDATWQRYGVESFTCARLLAAARASIEHSAALVFC